MNYVFYILYFLKFTDLEKIPENYQIFYPLDVCNHLNKIRCWDWHHRRVLDTEYEVLRGEPTLSGQKSNGIRKKFWQERIKCIFF